MQSLPALLGASLLVASCASAQQQPVQAAPGATPPPAGAVAVPRLAPLHPAAPADGFEVQIRRSGCYGTCPSYELTIHGDGSVDYVGADHVVVSGPQHGHIAAPALAALRARLEDAAASGLGGRYVRGSAQCGLWATDMPSVSIQAYVGGRWLRVEHDHGCAAAPASLRELEDAIDRTAQTDQWVNGRVIE